MRAAGGTGRGTVVTGDTKVVNRGKGDQIFITTTGIGVIENDVNISADRARPGDQIILSGYLGDHGNGHYVAAGRPLNLKARSPATVLPCTAWWPPC